MEVIKNIITIVGCGPGSPDYITPAANNAVANATVLVGAQRLLDLFPDSKAKRIIVTGQIEDALDKIQHAIDIQPVTVLVSGDPGLFSLAKTVIKRFDISKCKVIPAVSSVQTAFARIGVDWFDAKIISGHHKLADIEKLDLKNCRKIAILAGHKDIKPWLSELVNSLQRDSDIFICENLTLEDEAIRNIDKSKIDKIEFSSRTIVLVIDKEIR
ncbi:MAG: precorrin-6y C5,15-methyltransferase (decarboxylating) subunit CbiE [Planctomycetes bacterium]|nr:precorrin-6y C5,15-methyltransferase (decarboxylating) subunit CbiE [Planctomycetota bacterium]